MGRTNRFLFGRWSWSETARTTRRRTGAAGLLTLKRRTPALSARTWPLLPIRARRFAVAFRPGAGFLLPRSGNGASHGRTLGRTPLSGTALRCGIGTNAPCHWALRFGRTLRRHASPGDGLTILSVNGSLRLGHRLSDQILWIKRSRRPKRIIGGPHLGRSRSSGGSCRSRSRRRRFGGRRFGYRLIRRAGRRSLRRLDRSRCRNRRNGRIRWRRWLG